MLVKIIKFHVDSSFICDILLVMKFNPVNIRCPACGGGMLPVVLRCEACELKVEGAFAVNEFASLSDDDLHFLRIFVHCEGRIRDMESALGVSYPTIKGKLAKLKAALGEKPPERQEVEREEALEVLKKLEAGEVSFAEAVERIKAGGKPEEK